jgi:ribosomal RNA-processing protein 8
MGTNLADFIRDGYRVLKPDGRLSIAEVRSRFESPTSSNSGSEASLQEFVQVLDRLGFETYHTDRSNAMFLLLNLIKNGKKPKKDF